MQTVSGLDGLRALPPDAVISIGNYDGVHMGHRRIVDQMRRLREQKPGRMMAVVTFEPHPLTVLRPQAAPPRLLTAEMKGRLLEQLGVDFMVELAPEPAVLNLTAEAFWEILRDQVRPAHIVEGGSFTFGKNRGGNAARLRQWAQGTGIEVQVAEAAEVGLLDMFRVAVSSSLVRWLLTQGRMRDAAICLGRAYELRGPVVRGHERGRTIGVPTVNLAVENQLVPCDGVYAGRCEVDGAVYPAAISIGTMPTFGANRRQIEAHIAGFSGDLYGREVALEMVDWVRDQRKFPGIEHLQRQLGQDIACAVERARIDPARSPAQVQV